jgi:group I intron endonuclease
MIGIYKITNPIGEIYIGQSKNIKNRFATHKYCFKTKTKQWGKLQKSFNKYGFENHFFEVIEECPIEDLNKKECYWQTFYNSIEKGLNCVANSNNSFGFKYSEESKNKMRISGKNKVFTDNHRKNMSKNRIGAKNGNAKIILDTQNGIFYETMKEIQTLYCFHHSDISKILNGKKQNNTNFIFV